MWPLLRLIVAVKVAHGFPFGVLDGAADQPLHSAAKGVLKKTMGLFQLTGGAHPSLREVNGGRLCVNGFGKEPTGYHMHGQISLDDCARIAHEQTQPLGFRWGRYGFDYDVYDEYATPRSAGSNTSQQTNGVDLARLFGADTSDFYCAVYVGLDSRGTPFTFVKSNVSAHLKPQLRDGPASSVCYQRWTMTQFFRPYVAELWFCYMASSAVEDCETASSQFMTQGKIFMVVFIFFLGVLGWIMADMPEFEKPLIWFARFLLHLEMGMVSVAILLMLFDEYLAGRPFSFFFTGFLFDVIGGIVLFIPYWTMEHINEDSFFNTAYLLLLAFSPCFLLEFFSYWSRFIDLVGHLPLLVGATGFGFTASLLTQINKYLESLEEAKEGIDRQASTASIDRASYASVATDEPGQCASCKPQQAKFLTMDNVLDRLTCV